MDCGQSITNPQDRSASSAHSVSPPLSTPSAVSAISARRSDGLDRSRLGLTYGFDEKSVKYSVTVFYEGEAWSFLSKKPYDEKVGTFGMKLQSLLSQLGKSSSTSDSPREDPSRSSSNLYGNPVALAQGWMLTIARKRWYPYCAACD
jgi:hypothetical protein